MMSTKRYGLVVDTNRCMGCQTCSIACKMENNLPDKIIWCQVKTVGGKNADTPAGVWPNLSISYISLSCQHCENPACVRVCPVSATYSDVETGVVHQNYDKCIGCRMCIAACPYTGVRSFNWEEPQYLIDFAVGDAAVPPHQKHTVEKCTLCFHRIERGDEPVCVVGCPAIARFFGDFNDASSVVAEKLRSGQCKQLLPEFGTNPSVYYLT